MLIGYVIRPITNDISAAFPHILFTIRICSFAHWTKRLYCVVQKDSLLRIIRTH